MARWSAMSLPRRIAVYYFSAMLFIYGSLFFAASFGDLEFVSTASTGNIVSSDYYSERPELEPWEFCRTAHQVLGRHIEDVEFAQHDEMEEDASSGDVEVGDDWESPCEFTAETLLSDSGERGTVDVAVSAGLIANSNLRHDLYRQTCDPKAQTQYESRAVWIENVFVCTDDWEAYLGGQAEVITFFVSHSSGINITVDTSHDYSQYAIAWTTMHDELVIVLLALLRNADL